ncbi:MAG TPA: SRPBCC domain-containing protein [Rhizomicrobium sp.]
MTTTLNPVLEVRRIFDATPEALFDAWLDREQWQAWIGPEGCQCEVPVLEPKVGGRYRIRMHLKNGREIPVGGVFQIVDRPHTLAFTWTWVLDKDDPMPISRGADTLVRLTFRAVPGGTELTLIHEGLTTPEDREDHGKGWNSTLNKLARYVKGETP